MTLARFVRFIVLVMAMIAASLAAPGLAAASGSGGGSGGWGGGGGGGRQPDLGPNVTIFDPNMPQSDIQAKVDAIAAQQVGNQFGPQRSALLFKPGTYGSAAAPLPAASSHARRRPP